MTNEIVIMAALAILWVLVLSLAVLVFALARQIGLLHERIQPAGALMINPKLEVGDMAPSVAANDLLGGTTKVGGAAAKATLLMFVSPTCPMCKSLLPIVRKSQMDEENWLNVLYASDGDDDHQKLIEDYRIDPKQYLVSEALGRSFGVSKLPYAVLIGADGKIASMGLVNSREHVESLFNASETGIISIQSYMKQKTQSGTN